MNKAFLLTIVIAAATQLGCTPVPIRALTAVRPICASNNNCRVPVYVATDPQQLCVVLVPFDEVHVGKGKQPLVVWELDALDPSDGYDYQFDNAGVFFKTGITDQDFIPGPGMGPTRFSWKSVNMRKLPFDYGVKIQRRLGHGGDWSPCPTLDPQMVNDGA